jgi:hypothetical protein
MEIERIISEEMAAGILRLEDPRLQSQVLDRLECTKSEWVQGIVRYLPFLYGNFLRMWAIREGMAIRAYMIAVNAVQPPFSRSVMIVYQNFFGMTDDEGELYLQRCLDEVKAWTRELGAKKICIVTDYPRVNARLGFVEEGHSMVLKVE